MTAPQHDRPQLPTSHLLGLDTSRQGRAPRRRRRRGPLVGLLVGGLTLALVLGLVAWWAWPRDPDLAAVDEAVEALMAAPAVRAQNVSLDGTVRAELRITATGETLGRLLVDGRPYDLLVVDDQGYLRSADGVLPTGPVAAVSDPAAEALGAEQVAGRWVAADLDGLNPGWQLPPSPQGIAARVRAATLDPGAVSVDEDGPILAGRATTVVSSDDATLYVTRDAPHRVVRLSAGPDAGTSARTPDRSDVVDVSLLRSPSDQPSDQPPDEPGEQPDGSGEEGGGAGDGTAGSEPLDGTDLDLTELDPDQAERVFDAVAEEVPQLAEAVDTSLEIAFAAPATVDCGPTGCTYATSVVATVRSSGEVQSAAVAAVLVVDVSIEGTPAGRCSVEVSLPVGTPTPMTCSIPSAAAVFVPVNEAKKAAAIAATPPGGTARWQVAFQGAGVVTARASVVVERVQAVVEGNRQETACLGTGEGCAPETGATASPTAPAAVPDAEIQALATTVSRQRQGRHLAGDRLYNGGGYVRDLRDAQAVLDAVRDGRATVLGRTRAGDLLVRYDDVTGFNVNPPRFVDQPTNVFVVKGTTSVSVVPTSPQARPVGQP